MRAFAITAFTAMSFFVQGQILNITPAFPSQNDTITIIYDATEGNGALSGNHTRVCTRRFDYQRKHNAYRLEARSRKLGNSRPQRTNDLFGKQPSQVGIPHPNVLRFW